MKPLIDSALDALYGIWVGDAFGGNFEFEHVDWKRPARMAEKREFPRGTWRYTDDTQMALSIYDTLRQEGKIIPDKLAKSFVNNFDISRGYGVGAEQLLQDIQDGGDWQNLASAMFDGTGSFGNGSAMRVAPIGAYFASDVELVKENAIHSSIITHTHPDAVSGAIAVALASAQAVTFSQSNQKTDKHRFWDIILAYLDEGRLKEQVKKASTLSENCTTQEASHVLGSGWDISAVDTVPFALWCAITYMEDFEEALWQAISVGGDADTVGAIVGGIVASYHTRHSLPNDWIESCESLPTWVLE